MDHPEGLAFSGWSESLSEQSRCTQCILSSQFR